jgi:murein L,D-transpeptidase YafK
MPRFEKKGAPYPPQQIALIGLKAEKKLELWAKKQKQWRLIHTYPILAASGITGPKFRQGDEQVPEGIYKITVLNPRSRFHLSLRVNYPNAFDTQKAKFMKRKEPLGGDIYIHGNAVSIGCLAMGDPAIEEIFVLVAKTGRAHVKVILAPNDLRKKSPPSRTKYRPNWLPELYAKIKEALQPFKS